MRGSRAPGIAADALAAYLDGSEDGNQWALIDNLDADEVRELAELAIARLRAVLDLHVRAGVQNPWCDQDGYSWPCPTVRASKGPENDS